MLDVASLATVISSLAMGAGGVTAAGWVSWRDRKLRRGQEHLTDAKAEAVDIANIRAVLNIYRQDSEDARRQLLTVKAENAQLRASVATLTEERDAWQGLAKRGEATAVRTAQIVDSVADALATPTMPKEASS